jgi:hypothetical protein
MRHVTTPPGADLKIDWDDKTPPQVIENTNGRQVIPHRYKNEGTYTVKVSMSGEFKWNNINEGASCSYHCNTLPINYQLVIGPSGDTK